MFHTLLALLDPGDEVLLPNPACPICESFVNFPGARPVDLPLLDTNDFDLDLKDLEREVTPRTRLPALNSPQNPTGCVLERETLEGIAALARKHEFAILADEICGRIL
jgi:aspartate aminotransferase